MRLPRGEDRLALQTYQIFDAFLGKFEHLLHFAGGKDAQSKCQTVLCFSWSYKAK